MKVLIDTNVLLDVALNRSPHETDSGKLLDWAEDHPGATALAWHTLANVSYMLKANSRSFLLELHLCLRKSTGGNGSRCYCGDTDFTTTLS